MCVTLPGINVETGIQECVDERLEGEGVCVCVCVTTATKRVFVRAVAERGAEGGCVWVCVCVCVCVFQMAERGLVSVHVYLSVCLSVYVFFVSICVCSHIGVCVRERKKRCAECRCF